ncbi:AAA family ATPase [Candidatus Micrarchaeota archaeon]|nr:AAA family ATPase [Candidatus Micrarchaeota archaeon]MBU1165825.1 AAA family ATPase [Candidatus Micrarchaeota archaeon]MBU1886829.1 AAA family ATPase [Candidatus Micrarchaeota archaeon]
MVFFISRLRLRNFKSFKAADVSLPPSFVCFAGPNGSGKSNLCDAIRFVMGEKSLKSLRAKRVKDLIHVGSKTAEVTIIFEGDNGTSYEIKRAIRDDGKILYKLNGKKTTRGTILEALKKYNLDESGRNTIAQGEVQRIINMNGKERRDIIDSVAGIADFEEKKKEAIRELNTVNERIKDGKLVLGERKVFLEELGKEKEVAIKYTGAKKMLSNSKGTLLRNEIGRLEKELEEVLGRDGDINESKKEKNDILAQLDKEIGGVEQQRSKTSEELQSKQRTNAMIRRLEELKAACGSHKQFIEDKKASLENAEKDRIGLTKNLDEEKAAIEQIETELLDLKSKLKEAEARLQTEGGPIEDERILKARTDLDNHMHDLANAKEKLITLNSEIKAKEEILDAKRDEISSNMPAADNAVDKEENVDELLRKANLISTDIERCFSKTKEINREIAKLDTDMLELKEKASIFKIRSSPHLTNQALGFISDLRKNNKNGIYGTVADLISFNAEYSQAVEAAAGSRLLYVVVDSVDTATEIIEKLKKAKCGRATFIPLDKVKAPVGIKLNGFSSVINVIDFQERIRPAIHYVFADTLLVDEVADAKRTGIGNARMVTLGGEIFERSGIVSGGRAQSGILSGNQLQKIEREIADLRATKESMIQELYSIREEESEMRARKSQIEIQAKTIEMKQKLMEEKRTENQGVIRRREKLEDEITKLTENIKARIAEVHEINEIVLQKETMIAGFRAKLQSVEEEFKRTSEENSQKRAALSGNVSSLRATIEGKKSEYELRRKECCATTERLQKIESDRKETHEKTDTVQKQLDDDERELIALEEKISSTSKTIEKLFERIKEYERELQEYGRKRGEVKLELEKLMRDLNQIEVKKATTTTRLEDINAEFESYRDVEFLDLSKDELNKAVRESEQILNNLGNVNMAAIDMYDKKKTEIDDVEERIDKLDTEREAILSMISEIEEHKKEAFFETFNCVSENFSNLFKYINIGQGHLYLNNPSDPFESGLFIKLRRDNQEHSLDALSGGEKTLVALMFIFSLQFFKPAPFYILDEVDAALDKPNSKNLADLVNRTSKDSQFIIVSHNDTVMANSNSVIGVTKVGGTSKLVGIKLKQVIHATQNS